MNLGKKGASWTFGGKGFHYTVGKTGTRTTIGIPGTGLSHTTYKKYNSQPPPPASPTRPNQISMGQPKRNGKIFFILGGSLLGLAVLGALINSGSQSRSVPSAPAPVAVSTPSATPTSTPLNGPTFTPAPNNTVAHPVATPVTQANATPVMQQQVAKAQPVIKEPHPPSNNYVPPYVKLTSPISMPIIEKGKQVGIGSVPIGTKVKLDKINGMTVEITYQGQSKKISASSTDLLPRMLGTADD